MKKSYWIVYGFFNYLINFLITVICRFVWQFLIDNVIYGCSWTQTKIMLSNRIEGVLTIIFFVGIYTSINLLVYKLSKFHICSSAKYLVFILNKKEDHPKC